PTDAGRLNTTGEVFFLKVRGESVSSSTTINSKLYFATSKTQIVFCKLTRAFPKSRCRLRLMYILYVKMILGILTFSIQTPDQNILYFNLDLDLDSSIT